jgi:isopenicillin N synthase-like dioxygenase
VQVVTEQLDAATARETQHISQGTVGVSAIAEEWEACVATAHTVAYILAAAAGLPSETIERRKQLQADIMAAGAAGEASCALRLHRYHCGSVEPSAEPGAVCLPAHADPNSFTLVAAASADGPILEVRAPQPGGETYHREAVGQCSWSTVRPPPGCVAVLVGEACAMLSGGRLEASQHRLRRAAGAAAHASARCSLVFSVLPNSNVFCHRLATDAGTGLPARLIIEGQLCVVDDAPSSVER